MRIFRLTLAVVLAVICWHDVSAQGVRIYKSDKSVEIINYSRLDSIVAFDEEQNISGDVWVDLGLSVKWASCNVYADSPEELGGYYAWAELDEKYTYDETTYKYCHDDGYGNWIYDNLGDISGNYDYDVSYSYYWGRMPTKEEFDELCEKCTWQWISYNGVNGSLVTGPSGNSIFLPAAGCFEVYDKTDIGMTGNYWMAESEGEYAYFLKISKDMHSTGNMRKRFMGHTVRAVNGLRYKAETGDVHNVDDVSAEISVILSHVSNKGVNVGVEYLCEGSDVKSKSIEVYNDGEYLIKIDGLKPETTYRYRAFVLYDGTYSYGQYREFTTNDENGGSTDEKWVDLGLPSGIKWAAYNIGANTPTEYGKYFAWGETTTKSYYGEENYKFCHEGSDGSYVYDDMEDFSGNKDYDAATANWGYPARTPTMEECMELYQNCEWKWVTKNGVNGILFTGHNGKTIFLPASGSFEWDSTSEVGSYGMYWTSTPYRYRLGSSSFMMFDYEMITSEGSMNSFLGLTIRPVSN